MDFKEITNEVSRMMQQHARNDLNVWFRGHANADWPAKSGLHRHVEDLLKPLEAIQPAGQPLGDAMKEARLRDEYKTLYLQFKADAWSMLDARERSPWGIVFAMQHQGFPTRLLDWTESFGCAAYFAQSGRSRSETAAIYALVPQAINRESMGEGRLMVVDENCESPQDDRDETKPQRVQAHLHPQFWIPNKETGYPPTIAVLPFLSNARMLAQRSVFTMMGDSFLSLEDQFDDDFMPHQNLVKFILEPDSYDDVQTFIDLVGIGDFGYYPDYEGLRRKYQSRKKRLIG
jgi:FRG domain-containing protein